MKHIIRHAAVIALLAAAAVPATSSAQDLQLLASWIGEVALDQFGIAVCLPGDLDGDGVSEIAIGASTNDEGGNAAGKLYIYRGGASPDSAAWVTSIGSAGDFLGSRIAPAGDFNHDGNPDLAVGAHKSDLGGLNAGKAIVLFGGPAMDGVPDVTFLGPPGGQLGCALAGLGDVNGDLFDDLALGAPRQGSGEVWIFHGGAPADTVPALVLRAPSTGERFGQALSSLPDLNGDGAAELLVGAPRNSDPGAWTGKVYLYYGGALLDTVPDLVLTGEGAGDEFGSSVAALGDLNGDGFADFVVGAPFANTIAATDAGKAYVFFGGASPDSIPDLVLSGSSLQDYFGTAVGSAGDIDGDGFEDLMVGAPGLDFGGADAGRVFFYHGGPGVDAVADTTLTGSAGDHFGDALWGAGEDANANGEADVLIGAWSAGPGAGRLYGTPPTSTGVAAPGSLPGAGVVLRPVRPNPFNPTARIVFDLERPATPTIHVFDALGRSVRVLLDGGRLLGPGRHEVTWNGRDETSRRVASGVYFVRLEVAGHSETVKAVMAK